MKFLNALNMKKVTEGVKILCHFVGNSHEGTLRIWTHAIFHAGMSSACCMSSPVSSTACTVSE